MYPTYRQIFVCILYKTFSCCSSFNFEYKMYTKVCGNVVYILYTFCIHQLYTSCAIFVNRKFCNYILDIKFDLHKNIGKSKFGFGNDTKI